MSCSRSGALHDLRRHRQLVRRQTHGFLGHHVGHALHLEDDAAGLDHHDPHLRIALALAHAGFRRLLAQRLVREDADPDTAAALDVTGEGDASGFQLARAHPAAAGRLQTEIAIGQRGAALRHAAAPALLAFAVLEFFRCEHAVVPSGLDAEGALLLLGVTAGDDLTAEDPDLDADDAVGRLRFRKAIADIGAQRVQRHPPLAIPLRARDLGAADAAAAVHLDALRAHAHPAADGFLHGAAEGDAALELQRDVLGDQLCVEIGTAH